MHSYRERTGKSKERLINWPTPVSRCRMLGMTSLADDGRLCISLECLDSKDGSCTLKIIFKDGVQAYRNINESYLNDLWARKGKDIGQTFIIEESNWIRQLAVDPVFESMLDLNPDIKHYVIVTIDDVVEVISFDPPKILT